MTREQIEPNSEEIQTIKNKNKNKNDSNERKGHPTCINGPLLSLHSSSLSSLIFLVEFSNIFFPRHVSMAPQASPNIIGFNPS